MEVTQDAKRLVLLSLALSLWASFFWVVVFLEAATCPGALFCPAGGTGPELDAIFGHRMEPFKLGWSIAMVTYFPHALLSAGLYVWLLGPKAEEEFSRKLTISYLIPATVFMALPWVLGMAYAMSVLLVSWDVVQATSFQAFLQGPGPTLLGGFGLGLLGAFSVGLRRDRLLGTAAWVGLASGWLAGAGPFLAMGILRDDVLNLSGLLGFTLIFGGAFLWTGLLAQYPSMLYYAWRTPADDWGRDDPGETPSTDPEFEPVTRTEEA